MMRASTRPSRSRRRPAGWSVAPALCILLVGCAAPVVVYRSPTEALADEYGRSLLLRTVTGERYTIYAGRVHNDTLYAYRVAAPAGADSTVALPLDAVSSLTRTERGLSASSAGVIGLAAGAFLGALMIIGLLSSLST
jgi:hypothetical protein